jgi:hypothetical protein
MKSFKFLAVLLLFPLFGFAWNGAGHQTGGAIAYYYLKSNSPATIPKVLNILKDHPWYNNPMWTDLLNGLSGERREVALFMLASTFPDDSRDSSYGQKPMTSWHFVDYPMVPAGQTLKGHQPESPNAEGKIPELLHTLMTEKPGRQKAIDICWVFHLIEDIHEPLHAACLYTNALPDGDRGGNLTFFTLPDGSKPLKLHSYWDGLVKGSFSSIPGNAQRLLKDEKYQPGKLTELNRNTSVAGWIQNESLVIAKQDAYMGGKLCGTQKAPTAMPATYATNAAVIGERRVVLAGIRVGMVLAETLK